MNNEKLIKLPKQVEELTSQMETIKSYTINVKDFGAKGDGINDDTIEIQNALNFAKNIFLNGTRPTIYFPNGIYLITNNLTLSNTEFVLKMDGWLYYNNDVKYGFLFDRCKNLELDLKFKGKNMVISDFHYVKDWASSVPNMTVGVRLLGCTSVKLDSTFDKFYGRGIESEGSWQFNFGKIKGQVGQCIFIKRTSGSGLLNSGIGNLGSIHVEEIVGSYFNGSDINITYYENYIPKSTLAMGIRFEDCSSIWVTNMSVGYYGNDYIVALDRCSSFNFSHLFVYGQWSNGVADIDSGSGLYLSECDSGLINLMSGGCKRALFVNGLIATTINWSDKLSRDLGVINSTATFPVKAVTINVNSKSRCGRGLDITDNSGGTQIIDGLTINSNITDKNGISTDIYDMHINNATSIVYLNGKIGNVELPASNKCILNCKYDTVSNAPQIDIKGLVTSVTPTLIDTNYAISSGLSTNKISRIGDIVTGSFAIEHPSKTGMLARDNQLITIPVGYRPSKTIPITLNIIANSDTIIVRNGFINASGIVQLQGVGIFTNDIRWISATFSYIV